MLFRAIALSIALLIGIGVMVPLATEHAEAGSHKTKKYKKRGWRGVKKYSKRWWQLYRAQERRKRARSKRRRALRLRQLRQANKRAVNNRASSTAKSEKTRPVEKMSSAPALLPTGQSAPKGWIQASSTSSEMLFRVDNGNGSEIGSASISVVGPATGETVSTGRRRALGGVPTSSLRREVINRMIRENGWVVNDYQKEVGGRTVYVVVAQSQDAAGRVNSRMFYFTEADGRIYSVATNSATNAAERIAEESEKVISSLQSRPRPVQQASTKE